MITINFNQEKKTFVFKIDNVIILNVTGDSALIYAKTFLLESVV